jgi:hypothetical protein
MTPREEYKSAGLNNSDVILPKIHQRKASNANYGTGHNDMIMEEPDE